MRLLPCRRWHRRRRVAGGKTAAAADDGAGGDGQAAARWRLRTTRSRDIGISFEFGVSGNDNVYGDPGGGTTLPAAPDRHDDPTAPMVSDGHGDHDGADDSSG
ncbi:unnamed protein product [Urochloa humidicola]